MNAYQINDRAYHVVNSLLKFVQTPIESGSSGVVSMLMQVQKLLNDKSSEELRERVKAVQKDIAILEPSNLERYFTVLTTAISNTDGYNVRQVTEEGVRYFRRAVTGLSNLDYLLEDLRNRIEDDHEFTMRELVAVGQLILKDAISMCPVDTGRLAKSAFIMQEEDSIIIGFACPYACYVHDNMNMRHTNGRAKFLEVALSHYFTDRTTWVETVGKSMLATRISIGKDINYNHLY